MAKSRQVQHRPERDAARGKELTAAKQEVKQLKRTVSRLQKVIQKMEDQRGVQAPEASPDAAPVEAIQITDGCCQTPNMVTFKIPGGGKTLSVCKSCKTKKTT